MLNILHVSDFHFNIDQEESKDRLTKLVSTINKSHLKIGIIVFSGDIIDARMIKNQCIKKFIDFRKDLFDKTTYSLDEFDKILLKFNKEDLIDEFTKLLIDITTEEFSKAKTNFEKFYKELNVKLEDIILCCGNHDRIRIVGESDKCLKERVIDERIFSCFNQFCQSLGLSYGANTTVHTSKGYNFIIVNSNWNLKDKKSVCFNCQELQLVLSKLKNNKNRNIFVSHQPVSDFCENQKINYSSNLYNMGVEATIKEKCGTLLFGDKHGRQINDFDNLECICGAPLHSDVTTYNILKCIDDLDEGKPFLYKSIVWNKNNAVWDVFPCNSELKSSFSESFDQFSRLTLQYLGENFNFDNRQTLNTDKVSQLFKLICKIKESDKSSKILSCEDNIFEYTINLIENNVEFNNAINLKGMPKMGKTFYLNILYLTMFNRYMDGKSEYFPIYFNIDKLITDEIKTFEQYYNKVNCKFDLIMKKIDIINKKYDCKVIILIDGLNQKNVFKQNNDTIEKTLFKKLKKKNDIYYILTFNISNFPNQNYCINNIDIKCKYLIYFNLIDIVLIDTKSTKIENIIQLLSEIFNVTKINIKDFYKKILSLHTCNLDLRTLYRYTKYHSSISDEINLDINIIALKEDFDRIVKYDEEYSCKCAYFLLMSGQTYDKYNTIPFYMFWKLKNNISLLSYMTATFYIKEIENYIEYQNQDIFTDSILVRFIPRNIALLIRKILNINKSDNILGKFIDLIYEKDISIPHITHSMLYYLVGHFSNNDMMNKVNKIKSSDIVGMSKEKRDFFEFCKERSKKIAEILYEKSTSKNDEENKLISSLLKDYKFRENNRLYQILYYGDNTFEGLNNRRFNFSKDVVQHGFDFHNTFLTLIAKTDYYNINSNRPYYLREFDLFTLCDFLYSRLICTRVQENDKFTLFYYSGYNNETSRIASDILKRYEKLLSDFTKNENSFDMIHIYFKKILSIIKITKKKLDDKYPQKENSIHPYIHSSFEFEKILKIENIARIGWNVQNSNIINERKRKSIEKRKTTKETIAEHILETVYIALMFLPEKLPDNFNKKDREEYDKNKIIVLLLLHELGKFDTLDFTPKSKDLLDLEDKSKNALLGLLTLGATSDFADLSKYYTEMHSCLNGNDINSNFFQQINIIQREYKYRKLLKNGKLNFDSDRKREFESSFNIELNDICKNIKHILIDTNPNLKIE